MAAFHKRKATNIAGRVILVNALFTTFVEMCAGRYPVAILSFVSHGSTVGNAAKAEKGRADRSAQRDPIPAGQNARPGQPVADGQAFR